MKKLMIALFVMMTAATVNAQRLGVWYGLGFPEISGRAAGAYVSGLNFGVDYTQEVSVFDITGGISLRQKGFKNKVTEENWKPLHVQFDLTGAYNFLNEEDYKVNIFTGPYLGLVASKDKDFFDSEEGIHENVFGWQAGFSTVFMKNFTMKIGYEFGITKTFSGESCKEKGLFIKIGYQFVL